MKTLFPLILTTIFALIHYLSYRRVVLHLHIKPSTKKALSYLLLANMLGIIGYLASRYALNPPKLLYFLLSLSIGIGFILLVATLFYEILRLLQRFVPFREEKRLFFKRASDIGFLSLGTGYVTAGIVEGGKQPVVKYVDVDQNRFGGKSYTIVQISDMHVGGLIDKDFVRRSVEEANRLGPDLIAITGDLCDAHVDTIKEAISELRHLKSRFGTFYIVGNHEYFHSVGATIDYMKSIGIEVLENRSIRLEDFYIAGVYDLFGYRTGSFIPDINMAMRDIPKGMPTLLLAHQPKYIQYLEGFEPSLILSGHTHGGQIWPFEYLVRLNQPYVKGLHSLGSDRHIYVNSGIGFWGPPMRLGSEAEITCIRWS